MPTWLNGTATTRTNITIMTGTPTRPPAAGTTVMAATTITQQPSDQTVEEGGTAIFSVTATGDGTPAYQWQKNQVNLNNGGHYSGVTTATLTVSNADSGDAADYRCVVTAGCGSVTSSQAALTVGPPTVPGDFDGDGHFDQWMLSPNIIQMWWQRFFDFYTFLPQQLVAGQ